jgi:hypothetical protein
MEHQQPRKFDPHASFGKKIPPIYSLKRLEPLERLERFEQGYCLSYVCSLGRSIENFSRTRPTEKWLIESSIIFATMR